MPNIAGQQIGLRQDNQVLMPVQFPDRFVVAGARRVQVSNAAKVGEAGFDAARIVAPPADFRPCIDDRSQNWKAVALDLLGQVDHLLRALARGKAVGQGQPGLEMGVEA